MIEAGRADMSNIIYLLWFVKEMPEHEDTELLIGAYSNETEAKDSINRLKGKPGFSASPDGFQICPYELNRDQRTEGLIVE
jgi:hypothetical protein